MMMRFLGSRASAALRTCLVPSLGVNFSSIGTNKSFQTEPVRQKHKTPQKKATSILNEIANESFLKLKNGRKYPNFRAGDSVEVELVPHLTADTTYTVKGLVIASAKKGMDTSMTIINCEYGTPNKRLIKIYDPHVKKIKILQKAFIYEGKKKVRRAKIYYMENADPKFFTIA